MGGKFTSLTFFQSFEFILGGQEIAYEVSITMNSSQENMRAVAEYRRLTQEKYKEPTDAHFPDGTQTILDLLISPSDEKDVSNTDEDEKQG